MQVFKTNIGHNRTALAGLGDMAFGMPSTVFVLKGTALLIVYVVASPQELLAGKYDRAQSLATIAMTHLP